MFPSLPPLVQTELAALAARYGQPLLRTVELAGSRPFAPLGKPDRYGEVCMVVRRPSGALITARKDYYPPAAYRLLTGGVNHGEPVYEALLRETAEETGLEVAVRRFLAAVSYRLPGAPALEFFTFAFLLDELGGTLGASDLDERVESYGAIQPADLPALAATLEGLPAELDHEISGSWRDWGRFRAVIHHAVAEALLAAG